VSLFRPDRERRGPDPFLQVKVILFAIGAALAIAGMIAGSQLLVGIGILVLAIGVFLRFIQRSD